MSRKSLKNSHAQNRHLNTKPSTCEGLQLSVMLSVLFYSLLHISFYPVQMECSATELTRPSVRDVGLSVGTSYCGRETLKQRKRFLDVSFSHTRACKITASIDMEI
jgi:hypothetical protein